MFKGKRKINILNIERLQYFLKAEEFLENMVTNISKYPCKKT